MDPNETYEKLMDAVLDANWFYAEAYAQALVGWIARGEAIPDAWEDDHGGDFAAAMAAFLKVAEIMQDRPDF